MKLNADFSHALDIAYLWHRDQTQGLVEPINQGSKHLKEALESGKRIIVSTLQKFPYIVEEMERLPAQRFAVVIDEAHSSQSGELRKSLKQVLATESLEEAENEDTLHPHAIQEKVNIVVDHFHDRVAHRIGGKAKAMIVTRSRKHCVRYHRILERTLRDRGLGDDYGALVAFSGTDPAILYDLQYCLEDFHLFAERELDRFAEAYFTAGTEQSELYNILRPVRERFVELGEDEQSGFRGALQEYVRKYAFLSQLLTFDDAELERLYLFARYLKRYLPVDRESLPREVQDQVDLESLEVRKTREGSLGIDRGGGELKPAAEKGHRPKREDELASLSAIIQELNIAKIAQRSGAASAAESVVCEAHERFGANLSEKDVKSLEHLEAQLTRDAGLEASVKANTKENVRLTFEQQGP